MFSENQLKGVARIAAVGHKIDPALFLALCHHESDGWKWAAIRYEPGFYTKYVEPLQLMSQTEAHARATSWGICQIMGQVAREFGFKGEFLSELLDPEECCEYGCRKFKGCLSSTTTVEAALLKWNGGGNPKYPSLVLQHITLYQ